MSVEHSALTNRFLARANLLADWAASLSGVRQTQGCAAAAAVLDQAVCAWIAEITDADTAQQRALILGGHFVAALEMAGEGSSAELDELRLLQADNGSFLHQLAQCRRRDVQPPTGGNLPPQILALVRTDEISAEQLRGWIRALAALIERSRETSFEC